MKFNIKTLPHFMQRKEREGKVEADGGEEEEGTTRKRRMGEAGRERRCCRGDKKRRMKWDVPVERR